MSHSPLVSYIKLSPHCSKPRRDSIRKITVHHMAGNLSVEKCGALFADPARRASANYGIGTDGRIACYVEEENRSWCSSSPENDHQAITIEVANDGGAPDWHVSGQAMAALIELCVDICRRNGIDGLHYTGDKTGSLTMHKWFAATACPGPYLESQFPALAAAVNARLAAEAGPANPRDSADWNAPGNDFIVTASRGDRAALRAACARIGLPVANAG